MRISRLKIFPFVGTPNAGRKGNEDRWSENHGPPRTPDRTAGRDRSRLRHGGLADSRFRATFQGVRYHFFAFVYNSLGVPVAAGVLYPFFGLLLSPIIAAAAMSFSSVSVIGNALRLKRARI